MTGLGGMGVVDILDGGKRHLCASISYGSCRFTPK